MFGFSGGAQDERRRFTLNGSVGKSTSVDPTDIATTHDALGALGYLPAEPAPDFVTKPLFDGLAAFQKDHGLKPDAAARPGGPTERMLDTVLHERAETSVRDNTRNKRRISGPVRAIALPTALGIDTRQRRPKKKPAAPAPKPAAPALDPAVDALRRGLGVLGFYPTRADGTPALDPKRPARIGADLLDDPDLVMGLTTFQDKFGLDPDGVIAPGGPTEAKLNRLLKPELARRGIGALLPPTTHGDDRLSGGAGDETLHGGAGSDILKLAANGQAPATPAAAGASPATSTGTVPDNLDGVDLQFIHAQEGVRQDIYVPKDNNKQPYPNSGPTIGAGIDLGQMNDHDLKRLGLDSALEAKLRPYLGLKGQAADAFVQVSPLILTPAEVDTIGAAKYREIVDTLARNFNSDKQKRGYQANFHSLPPAVKTTALSLAVNMGPNLSDKRKAPKFWEALVSGDYQGMVNELKNFGGHPDLKDRRNREADHLEAYLNRRR